MIRYMLDTSICVELIRGRAPAVLDRLQQFEIDEIAISIITLAELEYGAAKSNHPQRHESLLAQFCAPLAIVPFAELAAETYGKVRTTLERAGLPIGPLDTLIASHALSLGATLVSSNEREFRRVTDLQVENWLAI